MSLWSAFEIAEPGKDFDSFLYPPRLVVILVVVCLVQSVAASAAGAWVYKE